MRVLAIVIYTGFLIASYWHLYLCFEMLSPSVIAAHLLAGGFELFLWFTSFSYAYFTERGMYKEANQISWMPKAGVMVVWLGNWVSMQKHFCVVNLNFAPFGHDISELLKWFLPLVISLYIPVGTLGLGQLLGVIVKDRKVSVEKWIEKNYKKYETQEQLKEAVQKEFGVAIDGRKLRKFYNVNENGF